jgi:hypothetical protein
MRSEDLHPSGYIWEKTEQRASAKMIAAWGIDYMHLAKYHDQWKIVHVLWQTSSHLQEAKHD